MSATIEAGPWHVDDMAYHADADHVSHSALEVFRRSVEEYAGRYIHRTLPHPEQTPAMLLGSILHCLALEPGRFGHRYLVEPTDIPDRRTKAGRQWILEFAASAGSRRIVSHASMQAAMRMCDGIRRNRIAAALLDNLNRREQAIRWNCPWTGLPCKAKLDGCSENHGVIIDLKTTSDPSPSGFALSVARYGYLRQAAWYLDGACHAIAAREWDWRFIAVRNEEPFDCVVHDLDPQDIEHGRGQNETSMSQLLHRVEHDDWTGRWSQEIQRIRLPRYAYE